MPAIDPDVRALAILEATRGCSEALRAAISLVPRETFVPSAYAERAYEDEPISLPGEQIMYPLAVTAKLLDALDIGPGDRVLQVGSGSGYEAAVLSHLAAEVYTIERIPALAVAAKQQLLPYHNVHTRQGDGLLGWPEAAPFDAVLLSVSSQRVPDLLMTQLSEGGRLVIPVGPNHIRQQLYRVTRTPQGFDQEQLGEVSFAKRLGDILVLLGSLRRSDVEAAADRAQRHHRRIGEELLDITSLEEADVYRALASQRALDFATLNDIVQDLDIQLVTRVKRTFLEHYHAIPVRLADDVLTVASDEPSAAFTGLEKAFGAHTLRTFLITPTDYKRLWTHLELGLSAPAHSDADDDPEDVNLLDATIDQRIIGIFEALLLEAVGERASDIHFERYGNQVRVRLRIDGECRDLKHIALVPSELRGLINVLKVNADLDISERRLPQGGRFRRRVGERLFDLRVQTQPSLYGEHAVIRLLSQDTALLSIEQLGFPEQAAKHYRRLIFNPAGLVLVVGPTGSGKSTTLYAGLQVLAKDERRKVITAEDPIEYSLNGVQQTQIRPEIGFPFALAMRSFVRQDPDVIFVGEIRDAETALEAIRASQTGHLVLSTLHANDTLDAIQRLFDLGMHPNSIASELQAVIAQRLAKRICTQCHELAPPDPQLLAEVFPEGVPQDFVSYRGRGCARCRGRGTHGRVAIIEFMSANPLIRRAITQRLTTDEMRAIAIQGGLLTMRDAALQKVREGLIPLDALRQILSAERMAEGA